MEDWLLMMLTDSALPTGGFVASFGLEAAVHSKHANPHIDPDYAIITNLPSQPLSSSATVSPIKPPNPTSLKEFLAASLHTQACSSLPYVSESWKCVDELYGHGERLLQAVRALDASYDAMIGGNHVARRASRAQGAAFIALLEKSFVESSHPLFHVVNTFKKDVRVCELLVFTMDVMY
jgi:urease accessory protein